MVATTDQIFFGIDPIQTPLFSSRKKEHANIFLYNFSLLNETSEAFLKPISHTLFEQISRPAFLKGDGYLHYLLS